MEKWQLDGYVNRREAIGRLVGAGLGIVSILKGEVGFADALTQSPTTPTPRKKATVETIHGPLDVAKLGFTLTHEHIAVTSAGFWQAWPGYFGGRADYVAKAVDRLKKVKDGGVDTLVDLTTIDLGRDIRLIEEVSRKSGLQIIACTGHWLDPSRSMSARTIEELSGFFIREIEVGIEGTDIKAGVIKVATDREGATPFIEKALRGAARASKATGVPIETHTFAQMRTGDKQAEIFESEGLSPSMACIGHTDDTDDMGYILGLARRGYYLGMDRLSSGIPVPGVDGRQGGAAPPSVGAGFVRWQKRAECIKGVVDGGFGNQLLLSHDYGGLGLITSLGAPATTAAKDLRNPDGLLFVTRKIIPYLREIGVSEQAVHAMTIDNPRRFFGGV